MTGRTSSICRWRDSAGIPSGPPPTVNDVLADTDVIVRGVLGEPKTYLSEDQAVILTDYPIIKPSILYQSTATRTLTPGLPAITITLLGGTYTRNGLSFTTKHEALPLPDPGIEGLFLLTRVGDQYRIAGRYFGAFKTTNGRVANLAMKRDYAPEYDGAPVSQVIEALVSQAQSRRP